MLPSSLPLVPANEFAFSALKNRNVNYFGSERTAYDRTVVLYYHKMKFKLGLAMSSGFRSNTISMREKWFSSVL